MPRGVPDFGQCPTPGQRMADEGVPAVMNSEHAKAFPPERLARGEEPAAEGVALKR